MIKSFFIALGLLTRIPIPKIFHIQKKDSEKLYGWSVLFYPLVGLLIGSLLLAVSWGLSLLTLPAHGLIEAAILLATWVLITGALHLDGLADSADAWLGGYGDKNKTLAIMKDPYSGPAAVVILLLVFLLKFSAIISISWPVILLSPVIARAAAMLLLATTPYVRKGGMGESAVNHLSVKMVWFVVLLVSILSIYLLREASIGIIIIFFIGYLCRYMMLNRIGGITGDTTGALIEIIEATSLIVFILFTNINIFN